MQLCGLQCMAVGGSSKARAQERSRPTVHQGAESCHNRVHRANNTSNLASFAPLATHTRAPARDTRTFLIPVSNLKAAHGQNCYNIKPHTPYNTWICSFSSDSNNNL